MFDFGAYLDEYHVFHSPAAKLSLRGHRSGGVIILVKKNLANCVVSEINCRKDDIVLLKLRMHFLHKYLILVCIYVPLIDSSYYENKENKCYISVGRRTTPSAGRIASHINVGLW